MTTFRRLLIGTTLAIIACGMLSANSIYSLSSSAAFATDDDYTLTLGDFNPTLGTLTSATLYFLASESISTITLQNSASTAQTFDFDATSNVVKNMTNSAGSVDIYRNESLDLFDTGSGPGEAGSPDPEVPITLGPAGMGECPKYAPSVSCSSVNYTPPNLIVNNTDSVYGNSVGTGLGGLQGVMLVIGDPGDYVGTGTFALVGSTLSGLAVSGGGNNLLYQIKSNATFQAEIDYGYIASSESAEPATLTLIGGAFLGLSFFGKIIRTTLRR
jgi:hypothetical protein